MRLPTDDLLLPGADPAGSADDFGDGLLAEAAPAPAGAGAGALAAAAPRTFDPSAYPYSAVVFITDQINGQTWQGSGVLITPDEVLTAAHIVFDGGLATNIDVAPAYDRGNAPFGHATGTVTHYSQVTFDGTMTGADAQSDYAIIHLSKPFTNTGNMSIQANFAGGPVHTTGYPGSAGGAMIDSTQTVAVDPAYTLLDGTALGPGSSGGPVWIYGADGLPYVVGLVSNEIPSLAVNGQIPDRDVQITKAVYNQIATWESQDDKGAPAPSVQVYDATLGKSVPDALTHLYVGPIPGVQEQYVDVSSHSLNIVATSPNYFIHTGNGNDAISVSSGTNVLDGGGGSNFLSGGTGTDTFYVDDRRAASDIWSTVSKFHAGDSATVWGVSPGLTALGWADNQGAPGSAGLTLFATSTGRPTAALTLAGFSQADIASQRLTVQYGYDASSLSSYLYIHDNR